MSKIDDMIRKLCPKGVEYKTLGEIATDVFRGAGIKREQVQTVGTPCVRYGEIYTSYGISFEHCLSHVNETEIASKKFFEHGDILFAITGESVEEIAKSTAYIGHERCLAGGDIVVLKHCQNPKYLSYALSTPEAQKQKSQGKVKSKVVHASIPDIMAISIPVPSLPIQEEIVRILDSFTRLEAELEAELEARRQQYAYYRDNLLNIDGLQERLRKKIRLMSLGEVCKSVYSGGTPKSGEKDYYGGTIPWLRTQEVDWREITKTEMTITEAGLKNSSAKWIPENCVIIAMYGATAAKAAINKIRLTTNQACCNLEINPDIALYKFVYYCVCNKYLELKALGQGSQSNLNAKTVKNFMIPVPPLSEQERIVSILDKFDALVNDLTKGLPAELAARRQQYEYYRDRLLSFTPIS